MATRDRLIEAAQDLLDEGGPVLVTLREVGRRAGVSHNAPYKHFANKEELLAEIAARELSYLQEELGGDLAGGSAPEDALTRSVILQTARAVRFPERYRLIYGRWNSSAGLDRVAFESSTLMTSTVRHAQERGALIPGDPERIAALLRAAGRGAAELETAGHLAPDGKGKASATDLVQDLLRLLSATD
jgi:AcrR family transcriptional regulator